MSTIRNKVTVSILVLLFGLFICSPAMAMPSLQLDIENGIYVNRTTYSQGSDFTLYALFLPKPDSPNSIEHNYKISAAITPRQAVGSNADFGSITFGSTLLNADTMNFGTPPNTEGGQLPSHGIFPTYYWEQSFNFDANVYSRAYNVSQVIGTHIGPEVQPWVQGETRKMYYMAFAIDASGLNADYEVHFDLYNLGLDNCFVDKAPFSHDAASSKSVPEPSTLLLLGFGLMGLPLFGRKKR